MLRDLHYILCNIIFQSGLNDIKFDLAIDFDQLRRLGFLQVCPLLDSRFHFVFVLETFFVFDELSLLVE